MYPSFTLDQLAAFIAVVDEGTFSAAARRVGRVQSAVSYAVHQLEDSLGTPLFDRTTRVPTLTAAGRRLAGEARLVLGRSRDLAESAARLRAGTEPELHVVADALYPLSRLTDACAEFQREFPVTSLRLDIALMQDAVDVVEAGSADLGVCNLAGGIPESLAVSWLGVVRLAPVCAVDHPLAACPPPHPGSLLEQYVQIVQSERGRRGGADQGVLATRTWRVTDLAAKIELIRRGVGWGSVPVDVAMEGEIAGRWVRLYPEPWPPGGHRIGLHAAVRRDHPLGRAGDWLRRRLQLDADPVGVGGPDGDAASEQGDRLGRPRTG